MTDWQVRLYDNGREIGQVTVQVQPGPKFPPRIKVEFTAPKRTRIFRYSERHSVGGVRAYEAC